MNQPPAAFMSYVRADDNHDGGRLTQLCLELSNEVRMQTGKKFEIFQDRKNIHWGEQWQKRLDESIDAVTLFIPIITPSFFYSEACISELARFLQREKELQRNDLILPIYYIECDELEDPKSHTLTKEQVTISERQSRKWLDLRFEELASIKVKKEIALMAEKITAVLRKTRSSPDEAKNPNKGCDKRKIIVDQYQRGHYSTISSAIAAAKAGDHIVIRPGFYRESLVINIPLEILGDGDCSEIVIEADDNDTIEFEAVIGKVSNLTLRHIGEDNSACCVYICHSALKSK